jgi:hypothetical protein
MSNEFLITLNVPPSLEDMIVDNLLTLEFERGFSGFPVFAHHHENKGLSIAEQVTGRQKRISFQMYVNQLDLEKLLTILRDEFSGSGIQYWVMPVLEHGVL